MNKDMELMPRTITLQLSNNHCNDILKLCGKYSLTVSELLEIFLMDLIGESSGDEYFIIQSWVKRHSFELASEGSLLSFLYEEGLETRDFIQLYYNIVSIEEAIKNMEIFGASSEKFRMEEAILKSYVKEFIDYKARYLEENPKADWETEVEKVKAWSYDACCLQWPMNLHADDDESEEGFL